MADDTLYILDTSALITLARRGELASRILARFPLLTTEVVPLVCYVSEAEALSLASRNRWGETSMDQLRFLLDTFVRVPIERPEILAAYVSIDVYCHFHGRAMGKNDLWIAAASSAANATLLTMDRDFDPLDGVFLERVWIDPTL